VKVWVSDHCNRYANSTSTVGANTFLLLEHYSLQEKTFLNRD